MTLLSFPSSSPGRQMSKQMSGLKSGMVLFSALMIR